MIVIINTLMLLFFMTIMIIIVKDKITLHEDIIFLLESPPKKDINSLRTITENKIANEDDMVIDLLYEKSYDDIQQTLSMRDCENKNIFSYTIILTALFSVFYIFIKIPFNQIYKEIFFQLLTCLAFCFVCLFFSTTAYFKALSFQYELPRDIEPLIGGYDIKTIKANTIAVNAVGAQMNQDANRNKIRACKIAKKYIKYCLLFYFIFGIAIFLFRFFQTFNQ